MATYPLIVRLCRLACLLWAFNFPLLASLPLVDLARDTARQSIVDREPGQYLGHPTTVLLEDGKTILCVYPKGHGRGAILYRRSLDGGRTWSERLPVPENWATSLETPTIHRVVDAAGHRRLIVWSGRYPARLAVSEDDGATWSPLHQVGDWGGIVVMASVEAVRGEPGHYLAWFHDDGRYINKDAVQEKPMVFRLYQVESRDGGVTWSQPRELFASAEVHLCEPGVVRSPDGGQLALLLRENSRRKNSHVIFPDDEGRTWSTPRELPLSLTGDRHTAKYAPDGRLFISFRDTARDSPTAGDWVGWVGTYEDIKQGREGAYRMRLGDNQHEWDCAYPGVEVLPDGTVVSTTYGHWDEGQQPYILSVRFTLAELDSRVRLASGMTAPAPRPPGVVVAHSAAATQQYLGSPSLAALPGGDLVASHDFFGAGSTADTVHVYGSTDHGEHWSRRAEIHGAFWSSLFVNRGTLYLIGTSRQDGFAVIRKSLDGGLTWTTPADAHTGLLLGDGHYHCAPMPVIEHGGRLWRAMEDTTGPGTWANYFKSFMLSVPVDADLLESSNWRASSRLGRDPAWLGGQFGGWLEGNAVVAPDGSLVNFLRVDFRQPEEKAAWVSVTPDGDTASFDPASGFIDFPGGCKKFVIRIDPKGGGYWALSNWIPPNQRGLTADRIRNTLVLLHSVDLRKWAIRCVLLHHPEREHHAFQYPDFQYDGDDMIALVRTAFDDDTGGAARAHDANYITFHRWRHFRELTTKDSVEILPPK
ncbi:MAG TPA: sialidase family protein [Candidatus Limnocylindria bacterium]|nr:sialidase family protein [Candidatus Limnocylindria bacterium]